MQSSVFWQTLRETRQLLLYWTLGLAGAAWLVLLMYPLIVFLLGTEAGLPLLPGWLAFLLPGPDNLGEPALWLRAIGFGLVLPLGLAFFTIRQGSWLIAGEEERSTLGLLLASPLQRYRLVLEKFAVLVLMSLAPAAAAWLALSLVHWVGLLAMSEVALLGAAAVLFLVGLAFGTLSMALGSLTGKRRLSFRVILAAAILMLMVSRLPGSLPAQPVLRFFSLFYYYDTALVSQYYWLNALVLFLTCAVGLVLAWAIFERRDLPV